MADAQVQKRIANTRAGMHMKALEELQKRLSNEPDRACYGPKEVRRAFEFQAIDTLMISDELFRNQESLQVRQEYVKLVEEVKALGGCTVYVFSSGHWKTRRPTMKRRRRRRRRLLKAQLAEEAMQQRPQHQPQRKKLSKQHNPKERLRQPHRKKRLQR